MSSVNRGAIGKKFPGLGKSKDQFMSHFCLAVDYGIFLSKSGYSYGSRVFLHRQNGFFFPDGLLIEFQNVDINQPGPNGWDPKNVVRFGVDGEKLWEIELEVGGNGYREIRVCAGGYLEAISRDGLRKYWLQGSSGKIFSQSEFPNFRQVLTEADRCTWSISGRRVSYRGEACFDHPTRNIWFGLPYDEDLIVLWDPLGLREEGELKLDALRNLIRLKPGGGIVWRVGDEPIQPYLKKRIGMGLCSVAPGLKGGIEVQSANMFDVYALDPENGDLTYLRASEEK